MPPIRPRRRSGRGRAWHTGYRRPAPKASQDRTDLSGSPDGRYLIGDGDPGFLVWHDRKVAGVPQRGEVPKAVNNHGTVVGSAPGSQAAVLRGNKMVPLRTVSAGVAWAR